MTQRKKTFTARGGMWVVAQALLMLLVFAISMRFSAGGFVPTEPVQMIGVALTGLGVLLTIWGFVGLGDALSPFPQPLEEAAMRRQGAYRWMRHPIYSGVMLAGVGWTLWWLSIVGLPWALLLAIFFDRKSAHEEIWLREKYPDYSDYARRVKKFIPGVY